MATVDELIQDARNRMDASVDHTRTEFNTVRTGRASAALLDRVQIDYYGTSTPLKQLATINVPEPRMLTIQPFDPSSIKSIEQAIQESDLGLTPSNDGKVIRLPMPQPTEERRKELVKVVRKIAEEGKVAVRNVRRDAVHHLKELKDVGSDDERRAEENVQKLTDEHTKTIDDLLRHKEAEIMEVWACSRRSGRSAMCGRRPTPSSRTSRTRSRSSWTATRAGRAGGACRSLPATAPGRRRSAERSRRPSSSASSHWRCTPSRRRTGRVRRKRSTS